MLAADGQVTMGEGVIKHNAKKTRRLYNDKIVAGFAGSTADALSLFGAFREQAPGISRQPVARGCGTREGVAHRPLAAPS